MPPSCHTDAPAVSPNSVQAGCSQRSRRACSLAVAGRAATARSAATVDWLKTNFLKTELELGHCLRLPQEGPCECDLYLRCSKFFTTSEYAPRLRARLACEQQLIDDAVERGWPREVERHTAICRRLFELLADLGEPTDSAPPAPPTEWAPAPKTSR